MSLIGKNIGNYRVVAKIGEGGMGSVFLGEHPMIGKRVAIKTLHPDLATKEDIVSRFFTEARSVNDIGHPNIVDIVDFGKIPDEDAPGTEVVYFVMEFLDGEGLNSRLKREGVSPREAIHILKQCASALAASHKKNIVHRDLKPENIYLVHRGEDNNYIKILDFGIAKLTGGDSNISQHKTRTGLVIGTPTYMSPEQCEGKGNIDWRSDIYSLGVVFYEMITGRVPFPGDGFGEILVAHLTKQADLPSTIREDVPPSLEAIVMHMMEKDKNRRFQSMDELYSALEDPAGHLEAYGSPSGRADSGVPGVAPVVRERQITGQGPGPVPTTGQGPRPTTLSGASGEVSGGPARSKVPLFAGLGAVAVALAVGAVMMKGKSGATPGADVTPAAVVAPPAVKDPDPVRITIDSRPQGARITRADGTVIGVTPFIYQAKPHETDFDVKLEADGYKPERQTIIPDKSRELMFGLSKLDQVAPPPVAPVVTAPPAPAPSRVRPQPAHRVRRPASGSSDPNDVLKPDFLQ